MIVSSIMTKTIVTVSPNTTLRQAARLIFGGNISGLPVINDKGKLLGLIVEKDLLSQFYPSQSDFAENVASIRNFEEMEEKAKEVMSEPVEKFMSKDPITTSPDTQIMRAGSLMLSKRLNRLPVVNDYGKLVGIITQGDLFRAIVRGQLPAIGRKSGFFTRLAPFFDFTFTWSEREKYEIPFLHKNLKKRGVKTILDLGCGTGGHVIALAKLGYKVTGIDENEEMLKVAKEKFEELPEKVKKNITLSNLALRDITKLGKDKFDGAICMGNAVANFINLEEDISKINKVLASRATLVFHLRNFENLLREKQRYLSLNFSPGEDEREKEYAFLRFYDYRNDGLLDLNLETLSFDGRRWRSYGTERTLQYPFKRNDFKRILGKIGFKKINFTLGFGGEDYKGSNEFLVAVATRP